MAGTMPLQQRPVALLDVGARAAFLQKVYAHLLLAVGAFVGIETLLFTTGMAERLFDWFSSGGAWLVMLGGFMVVNWLATAAAHDLANPGRQYAGLFALAGAEALIFAPFLYYVFNEGGGGTTTVASAAAITAVAFAGLTVVGLVTRRDLSFMRPLLMWAGVMSLVLIFAAVVFGLELGVWFTLAMIALAGGAIIYQTQTIMRHYPPEAYVGASIQLFASVMLLFWYVLRLLSRR